MQGDPTRPLRECMNAYIEKREAAGKTRASTAAKERQIARRICAYGLGGTPLDRLTHAQAQGMVNDMNRGGMVGSTVRMTCSFLSAVCADTLGDKCDNPCDHITLPNKDHNSRKKGLRPNALDAVGVARLNTLLDELDEKSHHTSRTSLGGRLALTTGVRSEEACGLRWRDVHLRGSKRYIHIVQVVNGSERPTTDAAGRIVRDEDGNPICEYAETIEEPKSRSGYRDIPLTSRMADELRTRRTMVEAQIATMEPDADKRPDVNDLYVLGDLNGSFMSPRLLCSTWGMWARRHGVVGEEGLPISMHCLRHTFASRLAAKKTDAETLRTLMGHSDLTMTMRYYVRSDKETQHAAILDVEDVLDAREPRLSLVS